MLLNMAEITFHVKKNGRYNVVSCRASIHMYSLYTAQNIHILTPKTQLRKSITNNKANIIREESAIIKVERVTVGSNVTRALKVSPVASSIVPRANSVTLAIEASLCAEGSILTKLLGAVISIHHQAVVGVANEASGAIA